MLIGIIADTHDNLSMISAAAALMREHEVDYLLHAGDFIAPFSVPILKESGSRKIYGVYGNNDGEKKGLIKSFSEIGGLVEKPPYRVTLDNLNIMMMHEPFFLADAREDKNLDIVIYGHTHKLHIEQLGNKLILNPGEVCGYLTGRRTAVIIDTKKLDPKVFDL
jgi:putative phosphoesterase